MAKKEEQPPVGAYVVVSPFRDKNNFDVAYTKDQVVSELGDERLAELVAAGVVEVIKAEEPLAPPAA